MALGFPLLNSRALYATLILQIPESPRISPLEAFMQSWSWISFLAGMVAVGLAPILLKLIVTLVHSWRAMRFEQAIRRYVVYGGVSMQPHIDALVTLIKLRTAADFVVEVDAGAMRVDLLEDGFCPGLKFVPKYHFTQTFFPKDTVYFLVFHHQGEKEKFIKLYPDHVLEKDPIEFVGENPLTPAILKFRFSA